MRAPRFSFPELKPQQIVKCLTEMEMPVTIEVLDERGRSKIKIKKVNTNFFFKMKFSLP